MQQTHGPINIQGVDTNTEKWWKMCQIWDLLSCLTVFNIKINVPVPLLRQFSQLHKCGVSVVELFRVRVIVINPSPGFEVTKADEAGARVQEEVNRPQTEQHQLWGRVAKNEYLEVGQGIVLQNILNVFVNNPVNRTNELCNSEVSTLLEKELKHLLGEKLHVHFAFDTEVLSRCVYFKVLANSGNVCQKVPWH